MSKTKPARIFLIDDHPMVRQGLAQVLRQESHRICGEAGNRKEALERIGSAAADLAILDLSLGEESGLKLINVLHDLGIRVLVYSMHEDITTIEKAFAAGADGYVSKREQENVLFSAVSELLAGYRYVGPLAAQKLADRAISIAKDKEDYQLSKRERKIIALLGRGNSNAEIAVAMFISVRTVETYFSRIIGKLNLESMKDLRQYAIKNTPR